MDHKVIGAGSKQMSMGGDAGDSNEFEKDGKQSLSDRLKFFKTSQFDADSFLNSKCPNLTEKEVKQLTLHLKELKRASAEEMRKSVYANYSAFIRTAKEISALECQLLSLRNLLSAQATVIHGLSDGVHVNSLSPGQQGSSDGSILNEKTTELEKIETWLAEFLENIEVLLAERKVEEALSALDDGEKVVQGSNKGGTLTATTMISLQSAITKSRQKLADQLVERAKQPSTKGPELRSVVIALKRLGDGPRAHTLLLNALHQKLSIGIHSVQKGPSKGSFCSTLSQLVFSTIAQAANDSLAVFGEDTSYTSELVTWAVIETEKLASIVRRQALMSAATSGNLRVAAECVHVCLGHSSLLESRGLALSPVLLKSFKPLVEQALVANLRRIEQSTAALAASDDWSLSLPPGAPPTGSVSRLSSSAHRFNSMVQELFEDVEPLENLQLVGPLLEGLVQSFNTYVNTLIHALPGSMNEANQEGVGVSIVKVAETEPQQLALLANALLLADECLPRAASRLLPTTMSEEPSRRDLERQNRAAEQREWKKRLQRSVDRLRDTFCRQHALELIFTEEGEIRLNAHMYTSLDNITEEPEWFPSMVFQELFIKLTQIATLASDMFAGRERFATMLLMRLTETVVLWLSDDQNFWEEIEQEAKPLGHFGIQQFYLDMEFVIMFSSQGRYLSRNLQQVAKNIIARVLDSVTAAGVDPYSSLPEDEWFVEAAQIAVKVLSGNSHFENMEPEPDASPTASER